MKKNIFTLLLLIFICVPCINVKADENKGYVQITAVVDDVIKNSRANIEVGISQDYEHGYAEKIYLYSMNNYRTIVTLPEGTYNINYAMVEGDETNHFEFKSNNTDFLIKKDAPCRMYFTLGDIELEQKNIDNQTELTQEEKNKIKEKEEEEFKNSLKEMELDNIYDENDQLIEEEIDKTYKETTGNDYSEIQEEYEKNHKDIIEENVKEESKKKTISLKFIFNIVLIVIIIILGIIYFVRKIKKIY